MKHLYRITVDHFITGTLITDVPCSHEFQLSSQKKIIKLLKMRHTVVHDR